MATLFKKAVIGATALALAGGAHGAHRQLRLGGDDAAVGAASNAVGALNFYNAAGTQIYGGNLTDSPVAAFVQSTATIQAGDMKATLFGDAAEDWCRPGCLEQRKPQPVDHLPERGGAGGPGDLVAAVGDGQCLG